MAEVLADIQQLLASPRLSSPGAMANRLHAETKAEMVALGTDLGLRAEIGHVLGGWQSARTTLRASQKWTRLALHGNEVEPEPEPETESEPEPEPEHEPEPEPKPERAFGASGRGQADPEHDTDRRKTSVARSTLTTTMPRAPRKGLKKHTMFDFVSRGSISKCNGEGVVQGEASGSLDDPLTVLEIQIAELKAQRDKLATDQQIERLQSERRKLSPHRSPPKLNRSPPKLNRSPPKRLGGQAQWPRTASRRNVVSCGPAYKPVAAVASMQGQKTPRKVGPPTVSSRSGIVNARSGNSEIKAEIKAQLRRKWL